MISGFGGGSRNNNTLPAHHLSGGGLPIPFNIPNVLNNLLFEDTGILFDTKQQDMIDTLKFSTNALIKFNEKHALLEEELRRKLFDNPNDEELKKESSLLQLEFYEANHQYIDLVTVFSDMLSREQYAKLLKFSNIPL